MKKKLTNLEIHESRRNLELVATWGKAKRFENKKRKVKSDKTGRKAKHKGASDV